MSGLEDSYHIPHNLFCSMTEHDKSLCKDSKKPKQVMLNMEHVSQAVAQLGANISLLDLNKVKALLFTESTLSINS